MSNVRAYWLERIVGRHGLKKNYKCISYYEVTEELPLLLLGNLLMSYKTSSLLVYIYLLFQNTNSSCIYFSGVYHPPELLGTLPLWSLYFSGMNKPRISIFVNLTNPVFLTALFQSIFILLYFAVVLMLPYLYFRPLLEVSIS